MRKFIKPALLLIAVVSLSYSCDNEDEIVSGTSPITETPRGRFENEPFRWDYENFSYDWSFNNNLKDQIFIGNIFSYPTNVVEIYGISTSKSGNTSSNGVNSIRKYTKSNTPVGVYVGAAYSAESFGASFQKEINVSRNPQEFVFDFSFTPFLAETSKETGSIGYKRALKEAMKSEDYEAHILKKSRENNLLNYGYARFDSYSDLEKAFSDNAALGTLFCERVKQNSKLKKVKGRIFAQLISKNFTTYVEMANPALGFFKDQEENALKENQPIRDRSVYLKSLTYGKIAYVAIESEYTYEDVILALKSTFGGTSANGNNSYDQKTLDVFNKSDITVYITSSGVGGAKFYYSAESIKSVFFAPYDLDSRGIPIYCQGRYVHDGSAFYLTDLNESSLGSSAELDF